ncbi:DUF3617 domain-containing protein [Salmonella enterica]|uniref:DUF3617 domain-containing protein n=1 Tax=Salmonella enterica TaxID=28901 RepID=UPI0016024499|nr:DUF3617 domain-containing protein [Salmonella enterica]
MKHLLSAIIFPAMFINISNVYALEIQPGEWKMENIEMRTINPDTKQVLMEQKNSGTATLMCYTPKMSEDAKKMVKGFSTSADGCTTTFVESADTKLINETVCNNPDAKSHSIVETTKISDTEFAMTMKMDVDSGANKMSTTNKIKQTFVGKTCSEASKGVTQ